MNNFHTTSYKLYNPKVQRQINFSVISDLHFSYTVSSKKLAAILNKLESLEPDYILFPGDLIDSVDMVEDTKERMRLISWLHNLKDIAPTLISLGSHDYYKKTPNGAWEYHPNEDFLEEINSIPRITLLDSASYNDDNIFVTGITQSFAFYHQTKKKHDEDKDTLIKDIKDNLPQVIPNDKLTILLLHSPVHLADQDTLAMLQSFDLIICGHMHNGCVPPILYELWPSTRGLISPKKAFFPKYERNTLRKKNDKILVNGPLTMFQECTGHLQLANIIYPIYNSFITYTSDSTYDTEKVKVKKHYR